MCSCSVEECVGWVKTSIVPYLPEKVAVWVNEQSSLALCLGITSVFLLAFLYVLRTRFTSNKSAQTINQAGPTPVETEPVESYTETVEPVKVESPKARSPVKSPNPKKAVTPKKEEDGEDDDEEITIKKSPRRGRPKKQREEEPEEPAPRRRSSSRTRKSTSLYSPVGSYVNTDEALRPKRSSSNSRRRSIGSRKTVDN